MWYLCTNNTWILYQNVVVMIVIKNVMFLAMFCVIFGQFFVSHSHIEVCDNLRGSYIINYFRVRNDIKVRASKSSDSFFDFV